MPYAVIFPGQGAAMPGAGEEWRDHPSWAVVEQAEALLQRPLARLLLEADADELATTAASQLAVLLTSLMVWDAFSTSWASEPGSGHGLDEQGEGGADRIEGPLAFAGHSLGQITALLAAGVLDRSDGLRLAARRADLTQQSADRHAGGMAVLMGVDVAAAEQVCDGCEAWVANDNAPGQVVIAGTPEGLEEATARAQEQGIRRVKPLAVGHAFHTPLLADAAEGLRPLLDTLGWTKPVTPVVSNLDGSLVRHASGWPDRLERHLVEPVRWQACQQALDSLGIDSIVELGPGRVLTGLARRTIPEVRALTAVTPEQVSGTIRRLQGSESVRPVATPMSHAGAHVSSNSLPSPTEDPA